MSAKDFKFVSPGVFIEEIDNSQLPKSPVAIGPLVIGRARRGPAYQPVRVDSFSEFVSIFGNPVAGEEASDVWRSGIPTAPTFAAYAAQAWLKNSSPVTFIRLLGDQSPDAEATDAAKAGWKSSDLSPSTGGGAYGLFLFNSSSDANEEVNGTLAAVLYTTDGGFALSGAIRGTKSTDDHVDNLTYATASSTLIQSTTGGDFTLQVYNGQRVLQEEVIVNLSRGSQNYVRKVLNTNPTLTNTNLVDTTSANLKTFWLGQSYEKQTKDTITNYGNATTCYGTILRLGRSTADVTNAGDYKFATKHARSGWFYSQDLRTTPASGDITGNTLAPSIYDPASLTGITRLFKVHSINAGEEEHRQYKLAIEDLKYSKNDNTPYGTFGLVIRDAKDSDNSKIYVERYTNLSLDPSSPNYIAKQIGDMFYEWDTNQRRLIEYGNYRNRSSIIRVEMANAVDSGQIDPELLPFGVEGPMKFSDFTLTNVADDLARAATGSLTVLQSGFDTGNFDLKRFTLGDTTATKNYEFTDHATGSATGDIVEGHVIVNILGKGVVATVNEIRIAINHANGNNGGSADSKIVIGSNAGSGGDDYQLPFTSVIKTAAANIAITRTMADSVMNSEGLQGGLVDIDQSDGRITTDTPVTAGSGSAASSTQCFMAHSASGPEAGENGLDAVVIQYHARSEGNIPFTGSVSFPSVPLRVSASDGDLSDPTQAYFGVQYQRAASDSTYDESISDVLYPIAVAGGGFAKSSTAAGGISTSFYFSLDDLMMKETTNMETLPVVYYDSGSRARGDSITARSGSYKSVLDKGYDRFSAPLYGGFNAFDVVEQEPLNTERALKSSATETSYSMFYSAKKAIDMFSDPEFIEANMIVAPGILNQGLTTHMIQMCESRGDALALIDPLGGYKPASENKDTEKLRITQGAGLAGVSKHVKEVGDNMDERNLNTSYGATYYPWVRITDTISGQNLWAPPSIAALGAMSFSEKESALWFAPAGFNRGGLTDGAAGIPVTNVRSRLTSKERDYLYERNINPIASFPNEGIVIFGQKTLQVTPSALDRINVRRLMIFVKKEISRIASNLLFDQNVEQTWSRFTGQVNPFLDNIKNNFGLDDFRVILDESTTTPDLIDRNTIYAKIFLKPTRAVEFFAIDFVITNSGASFED